MSGCQEISLDKNCKMNYIICEHSFKTIQEANYRMLANPGHLKGYRFYEETRKINCSQDKRE
jgi:hypothetical protein